MKLFEGVSPLSLYSESKGIVEHHIVEQPQLQHLSQIPALTLNPPVDSM